MIAERMCGCAGLARRPRTGLRAHKTNTTGKMAVEAAAREANAAAGVRSSGFRPATISLPIDTAHPCTTPNLAREL